MPKTQFQLRLLTSPSWTLGGRRIVSSLEYVEIQMTSRTEDKTPKKIALGMTFDLSLIRPLHVSV